MNSASKVELAELSGVPEGWVVARLQELVAFSLGGQWGELPSQNPPSGSVHVRVIRGTEFKRWSKEKGATAALRQIPVSSLEKRSLRPGDIVVEISGGGPDQPVGRTIAIDQSCLEQGGNPFICSNFCRQVRLYPCVDSSFINLGLIYQYNGGRFNDFQTETTNLRNLNFNRFLNETEILLPPTVEQRRISSMAAMLLDAVSAAHNRLYRVPKILRRYRQAVLTAAVSGTLTADWRCAHPNASPSACELIERIIQERNQRYEMNRLRSANGRSRPKRPKNLVRQQIAHGDLPEIPETWEWVCWDDLADWITYGFTRPMPHVPRGMPIITATNVRDGFLDFSQPEYTTKEAFAELSEKDKPRRNEILITKDGAIRGRAALVETDEPFCISQAVAVVRFGGLTAYEPFLLRIIQSRFTQNLIEEESMGTAIPHISITNFGRFPVPLPPLPEQMEIVRRVEGLFKLADIVQERISSAKASVEKLTQLILAKAFRGELVPTEAELARREGRDYEPASALLERIRAERTATHKPEKKRSRTAAAH